MAKRIKQIVYYQVNKGNFGLKFPLGIRADRLARKLKKAMMRLA